MTSDERMQRESSLIATIRKNLPDFARILRPALEKNIDGCFNLFERLIGTRSRLQFPPAINQEDSRIPRNVSI